MSKSLSYPLTFAAGYLLSGLILFAYQPTPPQPLALTAPRVEHVHDHSEPRSSCWRKTREEALRLHPRCEACNRSHDLEAHHVEAFHSHPEKECDLSNVIVLCRDCHFAVGHLFDFRASNPQVREDAAYLLKRVKERRYD
jgi:hypothetical protein